jgi:iron(III) transport system substrate-binding protein
MQKERKVLFAGIFLTVIVLCLLIFPSCKRFPSRDQRKVVLYCSVDQTVAEPIIAEFEKRSGIKVLARFDTEASKTVGLVQRIRAEAASPVADVFWSSEIFHTIRLAQESLLAPYSSDQSKHWPVGFVDGDARWYGFSLRVRVIAYNTGRVSSSDAPRSLESLLRNKWKGRVVMAAPEFGTTGGDVASWFAHYGREQARKILQLLKNNK